MITTEVFIISKWFSTFLFQNAIFNCTAEIINIINIFMIWAEWIHYLNRPYVNALYRPKAQLFKYSTLLGVTIQIKLHALCFLNQLVPILHMIQVIPANKAGTFTIVKARSLYSNLYYCTEYLLFRIFTDFLNHFLSIIDVLEWFQNNYQL